MIESSSERGDMCNLAYIAATVFEKNIYIWAAQTVHIHHLAKPVKNSKAMYAKLHTSPPSQKRILS